MNFRYSTSEKLSHCSYMNFHICGKKNHNNKHELKKIFKDVTELYHAYTHYHHIVTCSWHSVVIIHKNLNIVANNTILNLNHCLKFYSEHFSAISIIFFYAWNLKKKIQWRTCFMRKNSEYQNFLYNKICTNIFTIITLIIIKATLINRHHHIGI